MKLWLTRQHALNTPREGFRGFNLWAAKPVYDKTPVRDSLALSFDLPESQMRVVGWRLPDTQETLSLSFMGVCPPWLTLPTAAELSQIQSEPGTLRVGKAMNQDPLLDAQATAAWSMMWEQLPDDLFVEGVGWQHAKLWAYFDEDPHEHSRFCVEVDCSPEFWVSALMRMADRECEALAWGQGLCELPF